MRESELIRKYIDVIEQNSVTDPDEEELEKNFAAGQRKIPPIKPTTAQDDDLKGRLVGGNRQISYMKPLGPELGNTNLSVGLGKPMHRDQARGVSGQHALVTIGGNPGKKNDFVGLQINQPLGKDDTGRRPGPGISAVYSKKF